MKKGGNKKKNVLVFGGVFQFLQLVHAAPASYTVAYVTHCRPKDDEVVPEIDCSINKCGQLPDGEDILNMDKMVKARNL